MNFLKCQSGCTDVNGGTESSQIW